MALRVDPFGPDAVLVRFAVQGDATAFARGRALIRHLDQHPPPGLLEATPGFTTLLLEFEPGARPDPEFLAAILADAAQGTPESIAPGRTIEVPVLYDGADLEGLASKAGLSVAKCIEIHSGVVYRVHVLGFSPGFPYLTGLDRRLHAPRRATPRTHVPAGAIAIGGEYTGIYPVASAGGWNLIGRTDLRLVDPELAIEADPAAFAFQPGDAVRFVPVQSLRSRSP